MALLHNFNLLSTLDTLISLLSAFVLGGVIGFERQYRQRTAGLRTNVLVAVGAAVFVDLASRLDGQGGAVHVMAYVVSGVGFLGAGVIMREEGHVRGLNTAATLWGSAAVGAAAGADLILEAVLATLLVLAANTLLRPIANTINRKPLDVEHVEVTNMLFVIVERHRQKEVMTRLETELEVSRCPIQDLDIHTFGYEEVEIEVTLADTSVDGDELDALVGRLMAVPGVRQCFWAASTLE